MIAISIVYFRLPNKGVHVTTETIKVSSAISVCKLCQVGALISSGAGPVHARVPIHAHLKISPKQSQLHNKLPMYMINLIIIYVVVNIFSMKNNKSLRKLRVGVNRYMGVNWSTTTSINYISAPIKKS